MFIANIISDIKIFRIIDRIIFLIKYSVLYLLGYKTGQFL